MLPSITNLSKTVAVLLLVPPLILGAHHYRAAGEQVAATQQVQQQADELETLIRLSAGLTDEAVSAGILRVMPQLSIPPETLELVDFDLFGRIEEQRAAVDDLLARSGEPDLAALVAGARRATSEQGTEFDDVIVAYGQVAEEIAERIRSEVSMLALGSSAAGVDTVVAASQQAEALAFVNLSTAQLVGRYAVLFAREYVEAGPGVVEVYENYLFQFDLWSERVGVLVSGDEMLAARWQALIENDGHQQLMGRYADLAHSYQVSGTAADVENYDYDFTDVSLLALTALGPDLLEVMFLSDGLRADLDDFAELVFDRLETTVDEAVADAEGARRETLGLMALAGATVLGLVSAAILFVARPMREFTRSVQALRHGDLTQAVSKRGPKEVQVAAEALNEALESLRVAEAQAMALADERLDDPVLGRSAPGPLGASLQAAVDRLTTSLAEGEEFRRQLSHEASRDALTRLANRMAIIDRLEAAIDRVDRAGTTAALLVVDLDDFKAINDGHGHTVGDAVLRAVGQRLATSIRSGDLAGRLSGDQFVVVAEPVRDIDEAVGLAHRVQAAIGGPINYGDEDFEVTASVGIAISGNDLTADELLRDADLAVFRAKQRGPGHVDVCDEEVRSQFHDRLTLEEAIRAALVNDEFTLWFQPSVATGDRRVRSLEALIRWDRPGSGLVPPDEFIPTAERSGLIIDIDRWVLDRAAAQLASWAEHPTMGQVSVAVNISGRHLGSGTLHTDVVEALRRHGADPRRLIIEVTETAVLDDLDATASELRRLRELGVRSALDDFGTGYMSLAHLRNLPFDVLKIDRSFVNALDNDADHSLVRLISETGRILGATITAEGVETANQAEILAKLGSDHLQGYYFSRPLTVEAVERAIGDGATADSLLTR